MIRDITIGQYYQVESPIHSLDPRTKLLAGLLYIISIFLIKNVIGYVLAFAFLFMMVTVSKVPFKFMVRGLKTIMIILLITVAFNLFLTPGDPIVQFGILKISKEGIKLSIFMMLRLVLLILGCSMLTLTTTPNNLTDGLEKSLKPLQYIKIPVHEIAMMMSIALRFIPILLEETDKIMKAQTARGADFENGNLIKKAKALVPILVPLFVSAFRRANDLAMAMEARCYRGGEGRTKMKPLKYAKRDLVGYGIVVVYFVVVVISRKYFTLPFEV